MDLAQDLRGDRRVEVDGVVSQALRGLVALAAATLKRLPHPDLRAVAILGVVLDTIHILGRPEEAIHKVTLNVTALYPVFYNPNFLANIPILIYCVC